MAPVKKRRCPDCGGLYGRNRHICGRRGRETSRKVYKTRHIKPLPPKTRFGERNTAIGHRMAGSAAVIIMVVVVIAVVIAIA